MTARLVFARSLVALFAVAACSGGAAQGSQPIDPAATAKPGATALASDAGSAAGCTGQLSDEAVLALVPASLDVGVETIALTRTPDSGKPMTADEVESMGHFLPGIDPAVLACVRFVSGMGWSAAGIQTVVTAYAAPSGSPVSGGALAEAAARRYIDMAESPCIDSDTARADLLCDGSPHAFSVAGYVAFDVFMGTLKGTGVDVKAVAAALAAR